jgi:hypothetical protein
LNLKGFQICFLFTGNNHIKYRPTNFCQLNDCHNNQVAINIIGNKSHQFFSVLVTKKCLKNKEKGKFHVYMMWKKRDIDVKISRVFHVVKPHDKNLHIPPDIPVNTTWKNDVNSICLPPVLPTGMLQCLPSHPPNPSHPHLEGDTRILQSSFQHLSI